ncbi:MAG: fimbria/pilus outer membrane usher protein [Duganella sp.]
MNGQETGLIQRFTRRPAMGLRSSVQNLRELELDPVLFGVEGSDTFNLDDIHGLRYSFDAAKQSIALRVDDALRTPVALSARTVREPGTASVTPGAVFNYDLYTRFGQSRSLSMANEVRYFNDSGVFSSTSTFNTSAQLTQFVRLDTSWVHANPDTLETWQVGDLISSSLPWSRSLRMGGVQWRKSFDLRPDLLTFPVASLAGTSVVPSAVSLYVNGVRQVETAVPSGPFVINQVSGISGAGQATLVTRDTAGRAVTTVVPLYVDTRLLAEGLSDYSFELGVLRRNYSAQSFSYGRAPVVSGSLRHGVSERLTVEGHGEAGRGLLNGGAGLMYRMGQLGVVSASLAASAGRGARPGSASGVGLGLPGAVVDPVAPVAPVDPDDSAVAVGERASSSGKGAQASIGYQYLSTRFSIDLQTLRASRHYSDIGTLDGGGTVRASSRANLSLALPGRQSLSLSLISLRTSLAPPARVSALSYTAALGQSLYLSVSAFRDLRDDRARGVFFSLSGSFGDRISANASSSRQNGVRSKTLTLGRSADYGGGFGWGLQSQENNGATLRQAQGIYLGNYGQVSALLQDSGAGRRDGSLGASGSLVWMDGGVHAARQVGAGFALVSTGIAGLPVLQENRPIGRTSSSGYLLVPNLTPYMRNQIAIDTSALPLDARIARTSMGAVPARMSGLLAAFPVEKYVAATVTLHDGEGKPLAPGVTVLHRESGASTVVGFDGVAFIDQLAPLNHVEATVDGKACVAQFSYEPDSKLAMPSIGPLICRSLP